MTEFPDSERLCALLLREAGISPPPTNLEAVSSLWPSLQVSEEYLEKEGYLIFLGSQGAELMVRKDDHPNRKRFTLAHELGHWVLSNVRDGEVALGHTFPEARSTHSSRYTPEETWCNEFAAKLLMPTVEVRCHVEGNSWDVPSKLSTGPSIFRVSEEAFFSRVADVLGWVIVDLIHGQDLHRVGRKFIRRAANRIPVEQNIDELLRQTSRHVPFPGGCVGMSGSIAYGIPRTVTKHMSTYLVCIMTEDWRIAPSAG